MSWYEGRGKRRGEGPARIPSSRLTRYEDPAGYRADRGLIDAVNVALHLGRPLLLTGQPGTGKTQLAYSLTWELEFGEVLKFETKSTSTARDLFYAYDALGRFHAVQSKEGSVRALDYLTWNAFGLAILLANAPEEVAELYPDHPGKRRSVVLIDEIDKAPRDFPNDLLNEVEQMYFKVPELGHRKIEADPDLRPVLILTSNSEKNLAEAFLRRCVFYHLPFPDEERLREIVHSRIGEEKLGKRELVDQALDLFGRLREASPRLVKRPSTSELLDWLRLLADGPIELGDQGLRDVRLLDSTVSVLLKTEEDRDRGGRLVKQWMEP